MTRHASMLRDADGLGRLAQTLSAAPPRDVAHRADIEDVALTVTARALQAAAAARTETRGCHHRADHAGTDAEQARRTIVRLTGEQITVDTEAPMAVCR
jgi:L-aspartate oxidase